MDTSPESPETHSDSSRPDHCPSCGRALGGSEVEQCPECGRDVWADIDEKHRSSPPEGKHCFTCWSMGYGYGSGKCPECLARAERGSGPGWAKCPHCDYDMTGSPSLRCPECGQSTSVIVPPGSERQRVWFWVLLGVQTLLLPCLPILLFLGLRVGGVDGYLVGLVVLLAMPPIPLVTTLLLTTLWRRDRRKRQRHLYRSRSTFEFFTAICIIQYGLAAAVFFAFVRLYR